jgi:isopentenyl-diphosphate Delta-isomerase
MESVILVDVNDNQVGTMEKMEAHHSGALHRAFSILLFNSKGEMLIQKRAGSKYHSGGLWTNACCSHPKPGERIEDATRSRLKHEMGIDLQTSFSYKFIYRAELNSNLVEHELDHVFTGIFDGRPKVNPEEVEDWKFININDLKKDVQANPQNYTPWFRIILNHSAINEMV